MRGLGSYQIAQMKKGDPRLPQFFRALRTALDLFEEISLHPYPTPELAPVSAPPPIVSAPIKVEDRRIAYSIKEIRAMTGISTAKIYAEIKSGRLRVAKAGKRTLVLSKDLQAWVDSWSAQ